MGAAGSGRGPLSTRDAARRLGVSTNRVGDLIRQGTLRATRFGRVWIVDECSLETVAARGVGGRVRPLAPETAWAAAFLVDGLTPEWVAPAERSRLERRIQRLADAEPGEWAGWLSRRAVRTVGLWVHPENALKVASRLIDPDTKEVPQDVRVVDGNRLGWTSPSGFLDVVQDPASVVSAKPNTIVRVWPRDVREVTRIPNLIAAADLLDEADSRSVRMGEWLLQKTLSRLRGSLESS